MENSGIRTKRSMKYRLEMKEMSLVIIAVRSSDENGRFSKTLLTLQSRAWPAQKSECRM